ncbi:MAG: hypothetical protein K2N78_09675 [Oscillospiraceae bacterium]|nr:hypothetical protein [Oscillospiraceae bacterium]
MSEAVYTKQDLSIMQPKKSCLQFTDLEQNKVYEMDCLELLKHISDRSVDLEPIRK